MMMEIGVGLCVCWSVALTNAIVKRPHAHQYSVVTAEQEEDDEVSHEP